MIRWVLFTKLLRKINSVDEVQKLADVLNNGGLAVVRTDTVYGVLARAEDEAAVDKAYKIKQRDPNKSCIILVDDYSSAFGDVPNISFDEPTSVLVESPEAPQWLLRANSKLAYRIPNDFLKKVIALTGPLIAPSANPESLPPARNINEAKEYFGDNIDLYIDGGEVDEDINPSRLVEILPSGELNYLR